MSIFDIIKSTVEDNSALILDTLDYIYKNPETGYREVKTSAYMEKVFEDLGYDIIRAGDIPGFYTVLDTGRPGPEILILGELDSLLCPGHPDADGETGAAHVCGHCAQCAALAGVAAALKNPEILDKLCGRIRLCAVPAEELIEINYRASLREQGKIKFFGGKPEFMSRGYFDGVDLAFMVHTSSDDGFYINLGAVGCRVKQITYKGKSSHAGGAPWDGVNALYAATQGLNAINSIRETFKEADIIRVHPIITSGGGAVNAIPHKVTLESYVRGKSFEAIDENNKKVNRALCGAALSLGANVDICDIPGYAPYINSPALTDVAGEALSLILPDETFEKRPVYSSGSTDMGDIGAVMPMVHLYAPGAVGSAHGDDYYIENPQIACIASAMWQVAILVLLTADGAKAANKVVEEYDAPFGSIKEYCDYLESQYTGGDRISYGNGKATVKL